MRLTGFISNAPPVRWNNDCTVRALSTATGKDYMEVFLTLQAAGRKPRGGFFIYDWLRQNKLTAFGCWFEPANLTANGTFLVGNQGHIWVVRDGVLHDTWSSARRYKYCYRVHKLHESEASATPHEQQAKRAIDATLQD